MSYGSCYCDPCLQMEKLSSRETTPLAHHPSQGLEKTGRKRGHLSSGAALEQAYTRAKPTVQLLPPSSVPFPPQPALFQSPQQLKIPVAGQAARVFLLFSSGGLASRYSPSLLKSRSKACRACGITGWALISLSLSYLLGTTSIVLFHKLNKHGLGWYFKAEPD